MVERMSRIATVESDLIANRQEEAAYLQDKVGKFGAEHKSSLVARVYRGVNNLEPGTPEKMIEQLTKLRSKLAAPDSGEQKRLKDKNYQALSQRLSKHITDLIQEQLSPPDQKPTVLKKQIIPRSTGSSSTASSAGISSSSSSPRTAIDDINTQARALVDRWNAGPGRGGWHEEEREQILQQANVSPELYKAFRSMIVLPKKS